MRALDPLTCPLTGRLLIEASAGTGKTYTIAILFLRLLVESRLQVDQILVVTFTDAATEELRDRIRSRVGEALEHLRGLAAPPPDPLLDRFLANIRDREAAKDMLADALVRMDEASVFTIHGFCARMLRDNAFDSGIPFEMELITDEEHLRHEIMQDFWRIRLSPLDEWQTRWLLGFWKTPGLLLNSLKELLPHAGLKIIPDMGSTDKHQPLQQLEADFQALCAEWGRHGDEVEELLRHTPALKRNSYNKNVVNNAIAGMQALVAVEQCPMELPATLERFSSALLIKQTKPGEETPGHPLFELVDRLLASHARTGELLKAAWLTDALEYLQAELTSRKRQHGQLYFDDLLRDMADGLKGEGGERLAQTVRTCFPVALIDEFQDTDPLQYGIFRGIYPSHADTGLFMIGDPKQAIYSFRGADIFTYMQARRETCESGGQYTLDTNWRSSSGLVGCVNALFGRPGVTNPFIYQPDIVFERVKTSDQAGRDRLRVEGEMPRPMRFWLMDSEDGKPLAIGKARELAAVACAEEIACLLQLADQGLALVGEQPLQAGEIAVLVRTHSEASLIQQALRDSGVASVTQARENVFDSAEAHDLVLLLNAVANPDLETQLRAALVSDLLGYSLSDMGRLANDDAGWGALQQRFKNYRATWLQHGFMVSFQRLLHDENLPRKLLAQVDGERRLTNLMHLAELLQLASMEHTGIETVIRWFVQQRQDSSEAEASELRLENDEALVQILTIHKSKGLEFQVVFLPFPWVAGGKPGLLMFHDQDSNELTLDLASEHQDEHRALLQKEDLAERLRLFYVAVTRARQLCVMTWGRIRNAQLSAPAWLLHQAAPGEVGMPEDLEQIRQHLQALADASGDRLEIMDLPKPQGIRFQPAGARTRQLRAASAGRKLLHDWRQVSYSGLIAGVETDQPDHDAVKDPAGSSPPGLEIDDIFRFPRGPQAGTFMHALLEHMDFSVTEEQVLSELVQRMLPRHGFDQSWSKALLDMLRSVVETELDGHGLCLAQVTRFQRRDEMAFSYPLKSLSPASLQAVLGATDLYTSTTRGLQFDPVRGLMRGFIDLVFEHQGRYYLVDYKSNHLGDLAQDYDTGALRVAMQQHKYDLQYLIYTVALHRYLGQRLPGYDYGRHFGGVYYLFLRGMRKGHPYGIYFDRPQQELIEALDLLFAGNPGEAA